jgi:uncharacterized protein YjeT (DUF2065 family)
MVLEGIVPFGSPQSLRRMLERVSRIDDRTLRLTGLASMICGVVLLYLVRH